MMMKKVAIASVLVASTTTMALGQKGPPTIVGPPPGRAEFGILALDPINIGQVVLNAPYTAEAVTEVTQALADGNRIERRVSAAVARDSRGRTRREQ